MSEKIFAWLLKLYPLRFREEYGASAMQLFQDRLQAEQGLLKRFRLWLDIIRDLAVSAYGPDTQSETGFRKAPRPIADKTGLICGNYKGDSRGVTSWSLLAGMERWRTCA